MKQRRESPVKRVSAHTGKVSWVARYTDRKGRRRSAGSFALKREAQAAIEQAYGRPEQADTVGAYFETWLARHPRSDRTNDTNSRRIRGALDVVVAGCELREWPIGELRRRHINDVVDHLLRVDGRAAAGVQGVLRALSAMFEDAITDEIAEANPVRGVRVRANDPRVRRQPRKVRTWTWEQMHSFARAASRVHTGAEGESAMDGWRRVYAEAFLRTPADTGMRLGEFLALERGDLHDGVFHVQRTAYEGAFLEGTKTDHGEQGAGRKVPCAPGLEALIRKLPKRIDTRLLFPTPTGKLWRARNFYRDVWYPAQRQSGLDIRPHEMRHSWITLLRAEGVDEADLADMAGHTLAMMLARYTHPPRVSFDRVREAIG